MDSDKQSGRVKELCDNVRHITQLAMSWFAFFVTVNYVAMSWLAKDSSQETVEPLIVVTIAIVFIAQNAFGVLGLTWVLVAAHAMKIQVPRFKNPDSNTSNDVQKKTKPESPSAKPETRLARLIKHLKVSLTPGKWEDESIPYHLYVGIGTFLRLVLISLIVAWIVIAWHYGLHQH